MYKNTNGTHHTTEITTQNEMYCANVCASGSEIYSVVNKNYIYHGHVLPRTKELRKCDRGRVEEISGCGACYMSKYDFYI